MTSAPVRGQDIVLPRYGDAALSDVLGSVTAALGSVTAANPLALPAADRYVVLLVDGLGWHLLRRNALDAPYLTSLLDRGRPITVGVPSTTATSLTSLGTGRSPGGHGVVGYTCRVPGTDRLLNALSWDTRVEPLDWQPHRTAFDRAEAAGIHSTMVGKRSFRGSGLTVAGLRGATYLSADSAGERIAGVVSAVRDPPALVYVYDGDLDWTGHRHGCRSEQWRHQLATVDAFAERLRGALPNDVVLLVTADHGMVDVAAADRVDVDLEPDLIADVEVLAGEARFRHLYCAHERAADEVAGRWQDRFGDQALVRIRAAAMAEGWFGPVEPRVVPRLGDVVVASLGDFAVESRSRFPAEAALVGLHGSLSAEEMLVPLLLDP